MSRRFVIGDIHGCLKTLRKLIEVKISLTREDSIYFVGDFIDRGPDSKGVLDYISRLISEGYRISSVRGNHEEMLLETLSDPKFLANWVYNGAEMTLYSFGLDPGIFLTIETVYRIPEEYIHQIEELPYFIELEDYLIVHAGFNFYMDDPFQDHHAMIWTRDMMYDPDKANHRFVIHGHTPVSVDDIRQMIADSNPGLINIDAGCVYTEYPGLGNLVAFDLDSRELVVQKNIES
jgi:serine/threonine protein phosphatase 1